MHCGTLTRLFVVDLERAHAAKKVLEQRVATAHATGGMAENTIEKPKGSPGDPDFSLINVMELQDDKLSYLAIQVCNEVCQFSQTICDTCGPAHHQGPLSCSQVGLEQDLP